MGKKSTSLNRHISLITDNDKKWFVIFGHTINQLSFGVCSFAPTWILVFLFCIFFFLFSFSSRSIYFQTANRTVFKKVSSKENIRSGNGLRACFWLRACLEATHLLSKKYSSGGELLATVCLFISSRSNLNLRPPVSKTNALELLDVPKNLSQRRVRESSRCIHKVSVIRPSFSTFVRFFFSMKNMFFFIRIFITPYDFWPHACLQATHLFSKKCWSGGEPLATVYLSEVESRTQGSRPRPRTQKIRGRGQTKAKDRLSEDRLSRGQEQECSRPKTKNTTRKCFQQN